MKSDKEIIKGMWQICKLMRYRRKLRRFEKSLWKIHRRSPNEDIEGKLTDVIIACHKTIDGLTTDVGLFKQSKEMKK